MSKKCLCDSPFITNLYILFECRTSWEERLLLAVKNNIVQHKWAAWFLQWPLQQNSVSLYVKISKYRKSCFSHVCILKILKAEATHLSFQITSLSVVSTVLSLQAIRYCTPAPSAYRLWLSGGKTASACHREVSLVLSISSGVDKKTDGTGEVRGPCYGWQVCLFGLSLISCFPPLHTLHWLCLQPDLEVTTQRWIKATFHRESTPTAPLTTQVNSKHERWLWASFLLLGHEQQLTNLYSHGWAELKYCKGDFIQTSLVNKIWLTSFVAFV